MEKLQRVWVGAVVGIVVGMNVLSIQIAHGSEIVGHRGASFDAPENTLASVDLAWKQDADAVEIDVWLTKDGQIVAHHDKTTDKTAGKDVLVYWQTYDELRQLDVGRWKGEEWIGERIPLLSEILPTIPENKRLFIEVKCETEILPELKRVLTESDKSLAQTAIIGFSLDTMEAAKKLFPDRKVYWVSDLKQNQRTMEWLPSVSNLIRRATAAGVDGIDLRAVDAIDADYVQQVKAAGLEIYVWTVNEPDEARRLVEAGIDGITTDRPGFLKERLARPSE